MQRYQLRLIYGNLRSAIRRRDWPSAWQAMLDAIGEQPSIAPEEAEIRTGASLLRDQLSYLGAKPAELAMVRKRIKSLIKLEDLPPSQAAELSQEFGKSHTLAVSAPYRKDYLLLRSSPAAATDSGALVTLYCSEDDSARELRRMEASQREDPRRAGKLLAIPACCIEAFAADCAHARDDQDTLNDDACRRVLATATAADPGDWRLNPLANEELLGFYPCTAHCPEAIARAHQVLEAMPRAQAQAAERQLRRPALYFRLPFFATFANNWSGTNLVVDDCAVNALPDRAARTAQAIFATELQRKLAGSDRLQRSQLPWDAGADPRRQQAAPLLCRWR